MRRKFRKLAPVFFFLLLFVSLIVNVLQFTADIARTFSRDRFKEVIRNLEKDQTENIASAILEQNMSSVTSFNELFSNISDDENYDKNQIQLIRRWFDDRPGVSSSKKTHKLHPHFPGYVIKNPEICSDEKVDILVYIHSAVENKQSRRQIRESWGRQRSFMDVNVKLVFIVGRSSEEFLQYQIETEYATYGDIVQGDFLDTFANLTYKAVTMLVWLNTHCPQVRYVLKVDDDMFVDMYRVVFELVPTLYPQTFVVACDVKNDLQIERNPSSIWYIRENILPGRKFWPKFCSGYFVLTTGETISELYKVSFDFIDFVPVDDAYLYGLLAEKIQPLQFVNISNQVSSTDRPDPDKEVRFRKRFEFISFRVKSVEDHARLYALRSNKLSPWEQAQSGYINTFHQPDQVHKPAIIV